MPQFSPNKSQFWLSKIWAKCDNMTMILCSSGQTMVKPPWKDQQKSHQGKLPTVSQKVALTYGQMSDSNAASPAAPNSTAAALELELGKLCGHLKEVCTKVIQSKRKRSPSPWTPPRRPAKRLKSSHRIPSVRKHVEPFMEEPPHPSYAEWPTRQTAARRIFRPHKLEYEVYRNDRKVVPVIRGEALDGLDQQISIPETCNKLDVKSCSPITF
jgi:hypothetical protein